MINRSLLNFVLVIVLFILVAWFFSGIFGYFVISLILSTILRPLTDYVNEFYIFNFKIPRIIAILISFLFFVFVISSIILLFIPLISDQIQLITSINYERLYNRISVPLQNFEEFLIQNNLTDESQGFIVDNLRSNIINFISSIDFQAILNNLLSVTGNFFIGILAVAFITFVLLYEKGLIRRQLISMIPNEYFEVSIVAIHKIERLLTNYLIGLLFQIFSIFCIASLGLSLFGVQYALTIAIFAAVANIIPYAGPILGTLFGIIVGISTLGFGGTNEMIILSAKIVSVFAVVQLTDNLVLQPLIFSKSVKAHPLEIFVIIFAGAAIAGTIGMIAAIPTYTILRVIFVELYNGYKQYHIFKNKE